MIAIYLLFALRGDALTADLSTPLLLNKQCVHRAGVQPHFHEITSAYMDILEVGSRVSPRVLIHGTEALLPGSKWYITDDGMSASWTL
jgi:hypothetical protein